MSFTISTIARSLGVPYQGDGSLKVSSVAEPASAACDQLALAMRPDFAKGLAQGAAQAAMLWDGADWQSYGLKAAILAPRPRFAMSGLSVMMDLGQGYSTGIHPSAVIEAGAVIGDGCEIGPFCVIGPEVVLGKGVVLKSHVVVTGDTHIGEDTVVFPFSVIGEIPQDLKFDGEKTRLRIGARNRIREHVTMNTGTAGGGGETRIGDDGLFMAGCHIAHDAQIGDRVIVVNSSAVAGHCHIEDDVIIYSGATILGGDTVIGARSVVGGNVWLTHSVPADTKVFMESPHLIFKSQETNQEVSHENPV